MCALIILHKYINDRVVFFLNQYFLLIYNYNQIKALTFISDVIHMYNNIQINKVQEKV